MPSGTITSTIPFFLKADNDAIRSSGSFPFYTRGSSHSGLTAHIDCFIQGTGGFESYIPFYLNSSNSAQVSGNLNLYTAGHYLQANNSISLFISNVGTSNNINFYTAGSGVTAGAMPFDSHVNFFLKRAESNFINLFLKTNETPYSSGINLYTFGAYLITSGINMVIPGIGKPTNSLTLFVRGF